MGSTGPVAAASAVNPVVLAATALATGAQLYQAYQSNQATQAAKGAAQAEGTAIQGQIDASAKQTKDLEASQAQEAANANSTASAQALLKQRTAVAGSSAQGSILTSPLGAPTAPVIQKTLLGQ